MMIFHRAHLDLKTLGYSGPITPKALDAAIRQKPYWGSLDFTERKLIRLYYERLMRQGATRQAQQIKQVMDRVLVCRLLATATSALFVVYIIGIALQQAVFKYISPLDRRFVPRTRFSLEGGPP
jgi:hypothetical protein